MKPQTELIEDSLQQSSVSKFPAVEPRIKDRRMRSKGTILTIVTSALLGVALAYGSWSYTHPAMILLPADDIARIRAAKSKYDQAVAPINAQFNAERGAVVKRYSIPDGSTPVATVDGTQLTGWLAPDGSQIILSSADMDILKGIVARLQAAAKGPNDELAAVEKDIRARNKIPATSEPVFDSGGVPIAYKAKK